MIRQQMTRRRFMGTTAAAACGMLTPCWHRLSASPVRSQTEFPSTPHFWYRLQPAGPYIDSQRDNKAFGFADGKVFLSEDNGRTWPHSIAFPDAEQDHVQLHSEEREHPLRHRREAVPQHGQPEDVPADHGEGCRRRRLPAAHAAEPGQPGLVLPPARTAFTRGTSTAWRCWCGGTTATSAAAATPVNIYYSTDSGQTVKIAYAFGQNPHYPGQRLAGRRRDGHAAGRPRQPGDLPPHPLRGLQPGRERVLRLHRRLRSSRRGTSATGCGARTTRRRTSGTGRSSCPRVELAVQVAAASTSSTGKSTGSATRTARSRTTAGSSAATRPTSPNPEAHTMLFNPEYECGQHDHPGRRDSGVALCARRRRIHTGFIFSPDMGRTWAQYDLQGVRQAVARPLPPEEQRRLVPRGLALGMDRARRGDVHQAERIRRLKAPVVTKGL